MADTVVSFLLENLRQLIQKEGSLPGLSVELKSLCDLLELMQPFILDCEGASQEQRAAKEFLNEIRDLAYDAEDAINSHITPAAQDSRKGNFDRVLDKWKEPGIIDESLTKIKEIHERMKEVYNSKEKLGIVIKKALVEGPSRKQRHVVVEEVNVVGFENEVNTLLEQLTGGKHAQRAIISIVGMGGLGKTTLAKKIYNHSRTMKQFPRFRAWVTVSQEYKLTELLQKIIKQFTRITKDMEKMDNKELGEVLKNCLSVDKYLVVMDDVWENEVWQDLESFFPDQKNGSRVMITTRVKEVAQQANSDGRFPPHHLRFLNNIESWELFQKKAFQGENYITKEELMIGRQIAEKCGGLPLAIVVLGSLLSKNQRKFMEGRKVSEQVSTFLAQHSYECADILALSYYDLPYYLKPCFLYFGSFPEDQEIPARQLIQLWIAEGFIQVKDGEKVEDTAETYLDKLIDRSLIQVARTRSDYGVKTCRIHDLLRDLCISEAQKERSFQIIHSYVMDSPTTCRIHDPRRLAGNYNALLHIRRELHTVAKVRSLLCFTQSSDPSKKLKSYDFLNIYQSLPLLRVLRIEGSVGNVLPSNMGSLIHLRYLGIIRSTTSTTILPSLNNNWNLQILDIRSRHLPDAPDEIWMMKRLRHVYFQGQTRLPQPPRSSSQKEGLLEYLLTLSTICPSSCTSEIFYELPNLTKLGVRGDLESYIESLNVNIVKLKHLQSLKLVRTLSSASLTNIPNQLPRKLTKLTLRDTALHQDPMPELGMLENLQILKLVGNTYNGSQMVCSAEGFPRLQFLQIVNSKINDLKIEKGAMPNVNRLVVRDCDHLCNFDEVDLQMSAQLDLKHATEQLQEITSTMVEEKVTEDIEDESTEHKVGNREIKENEDASIHGSPNIKMDRDRLAGEMADTSVVSFLLEDLSQLLLKDVDLVLGVKVEVQSLCDHLDRLHPILRDCERVQGDDENAKMFLNNIRNLSYDAEDTIYRYVISIAQDCSKNCSSRIIRDFVNIKMRQEVAQKIVNINMKMEEFYFNKDKYGIGVKKASEASGERPSSRTARVVEEEDIVGFEDEANTLVERLIGGKSERAVISIVGMGGLGKTALAKKIYNHQSITNWFQCRAWVEVSQDYKPTELLQSLIEQFIKITEEMKVMSEKNLGKVLQNQLTDSKYFIVMDDVWIPQVWRNLNSFFPNQGNGSRIMITTRNNEVAMQANLVPNCPPHYLRYLDKEESWELFRNKAFRGENCSPQCEEVGRQVVEKCGGLPRAIASLGRLLSEKEPNFNKWREATKHLGTFLYEDPKLCKDVLALSYVALPHYLKPCFLYFGVFPEDHEIHARQLIQLWIAEGFIQVHDGETLEDTAEKYLEKLVDRSLIQVARRRSDCGVKTCRIHVLLRDLCISEAQKDRFFQIHGHEINSPTQINPRRLAGSYDNLKDIICSSYAVAKVRSLLCFTERSDTLGSSAHDNYTFGDIYKKLSLLRVMRIEHSSTAGNALCSETKGKLIHLRYFRVSREISLVKIPPSICNAWNLQILDIRSRCLPDAPDGLWKMKKLRHVHFQGQTRLPQPSNDDDSSLEYLQTLSTICPSSCSAQVFSKLPNLLKLGLCGDLKSHMEALPSNLVMLKHLKSLKLIRKIPSSNKPPTRIPRGLPPSLTKITICDTSLRQDPMPVLGKLPNLQILKLVGDAYYGSRLICLPHGFPQLQLLHIVRSKVRYLIINEGAMTKLNRLVIRECPSLNLEKAEPQLTAQQVVVEHT